MSSIGPQLPPHLTKRKRTPDLEEDETNSEKHSRRESPDAKNADEIDLGDSDSDSDDMGPRMPTAARSEGGHGKNIISPGSGPAPAAKPNPESESQSESESEDDDDDFGPSLPSASAPRPVVGPTLPDQTDQDLAPKRDEWMLAPPPSSTTFSERDTTRIRARKFASKPSSSSSSSAAAGAPSIWTETPEEKLRRLQDSVLGRAGPAGSEPAAEEEKRRVKEEKDGRLAAGIDAQRGKSLYEEHQKRRKKDPDSGGGGGGGGGDNKRRKDGHGEEDDDPSKRAFDREKDMALGGKISASQRRELINKSANFGGRFSKGSFL